MECSLVMFKSDGTRLDIPLVRPRMVIGRMTGCDIRISINRVSREHCEILTTESGLSYKDLDSSNGVIHNGAKSKKGQLKAGDELVVGPVIFTVVVDGKPAKITPIRTILDDGVEPEKNGSHAGTLVGEPMSDMAKPIAPVPALAPVKDGSKILSAVSIGSSGVSSVPVTPAKAVQAEAVSAPPKTVKKDADEFAPQKETGIDAMLDDDNFGMAEEVHDGDDEEPAFVFE